MPKRQFCLWNREIDKTLLVFVHGSENDLVKPEFALLSLFSNEKVADKAEGLQLIPNPAQRWRVSGTVCIAPEYLLVASNRLCLVWATVEPSCKLISS